MPIFELLQKITLSKEIDAMDHSVKVPGYIRAKCKRLTPVEYIQRNKLYASWEVPAPTILPFVTCQNKYKMI